MNGLNMRNSKMKILLYCGVGFGLLLTIYLLSSTHSRLKEMKGAYEISQQQKDSLLAQLQVVYEQKNRVEKFLQQEKLDHKKTKEDNQQKMAAKNQLEREKNDFEKKSNNLQQEQQTLQAQISQLKEKIAQNEDDMNRQQSEKENEFQNKESEMNKLKNEMSEVVVEKDQLQQKFDTQHSEIQRLSDELHALQSDKNKLEEEMRLRANSVDIKRLGVVHAKEQIGLDSHQAAPVQAVPKPTTVANTQHNQEPNKIGDGLIGGGSNVNAKENIQEKPKKSEHNDSGQQKQNMEIVQQLQPPMKKPNSVENNRVVAPPKDEILEAQQKSVLAAPAIAPESHRVHPPAPPPNNIGWDLKRGPQLKQQLQANINNAAGAKAGQNNPPPEEDENYHDDGGDDDAAEEQEAGEDGGFIAGEALQKAAHERNFQDNDFEDNDGADNHAKEEGVVVNPK